jgi:hypothetical protein
MRKRASYFLFAALIIVAVYGCGSSETHVAAGFNGDSGLHVFVRITDPESESTAETSRIVAESDESFGHFCVRITDAKPVLPSGTEAVLVTFESFFVHREGGEWVSLPLLRRPHTIDLLRFHTGRTTDLIQPSSLDPGPYDRIRITISHASILIDGSAHPITMPSEDLAIDQDFFFEMADGGKEDLTIDFDLSQSVSVSGPPSAPVYLLEPVLHINYTEEAAIIQGVIAPTTFDDYDSDVGFVTVILDKDLSGDLTESDEEYTKVTVDRVNPEFTIFWLLAEEGYTVHVEMDGIQSAVFEQFIFPADLQKGTSFELNSGNPI